jgi:hypothetical protein
VVWYPPASPTPATPGWVAHLRRLAPAGVAMSGQSRSTGSNTTSTRRTMSSHPGELPPEVLTDARIDVNPLADRFADAERVQRPALKSLQKNQPTS